GFQPAGGQIFGDIPLSIQSFWLFPAAAAGSADLEWDLPRFAMVAEPNSPPRPWLTGAALPLRLGGLAIRLVLGQQLLAQRLQIPAQDGQAHVTLISLLAPIATP